MICEFLRAFLDECAGWAGPVFWIRIVKKVIHDQMYGPIIKASSEALCMSLWTMLRVSLPLDKKMLAQHLDEI